MREPPRSGLDVGDAICGEELSLVPGANGDSGISTNEPSHHRDFYLEDEHIMLQAGSTVFRVHAYFFSRESEEARALVKRSWVSPNRLVVLEDVAPYDLECFFKVLYCRVSDSLPLTTKDEWACVLLLSHAWRFTTMRSLAIRELSILTTSAQRIVLGKHYGIHHWLRPAYKDMCEREEGVSDEEGELLGLKDVLKIARARQALRNPPQLIGSSRNSDTVLDDIFGACLAVADGYAVSTKIETIEEPRENPPLSTAAAQIEPLLNAPVSDALCKRLDNILKTIQSTEQEISEFSASLRKAEELHTVAEIQLSQMREQKLFWGTVQQHTACTSAKLDIEKAQRELTRLNTDMDQCYAEMVTAVLPDATTKARLYRPSPDFCKTLRTALSALEAAAQPDPTGADRTLEHVNDMKAHVQFCTRVYACNPNPHTAKAVADARKALKLREDREVKQRLEQQDAQLEVSVAYCRLALVLNELAAAAKLHE